MLVEMVRLRRAGMRLRQEELGPAVVGDLLIRSAGPTNFKRPMNDARLWSWPRSSGPQMPVSESLFDPVLVHMDARGFSLVGIELEMVERRMLEHVQVWRCTPRPAA